MSFKVKDLSVSLSSEDGGSTCTTLTKPTGCINASAFWLDAVARQRSLAALRTQLRNAMTRA
ncbi:MAG: hypothetical protein ABUT39_28495 [Acidobacteriota bacterium]